MGKVFMRMAPTFGRMCVAIVINFARPIVGAAAGMRSGAGFASHCQLAITWGFVLYWQ
jgi:hypothetical protein